MRMASLPLVLLPGLLCDARLWRDPAAALADLTPVHHADLTLDDSVAGMARSFFRARAGSHASDMTSARQS